jgi:hypothetical protein
VFHTPDIVAILVIADGETEFSSDQFSPFCQARKREPWHGVGFISAMVATNIWHNRWEVSYD